MSKSKVFIFVSLSFAVGILLASIVHLEKSWLYIAMAFFLTGFALFYRSSLKNNWPAVVLLILFFIAVGSWRLQLSQKPNEFEELLGKKQQLEGLIVSDIDIRTDKQLFSFRPLGFNQSILVTTTKSEHYFYGDKIVLTDKLAEAKNFSDFDYKGYLERQNVYALASYPKLLILKNNQANKIKYQLLRLKDLFVKQVGKILPEPQNNLLLGILIGARRGIPQTVLDDFNNTGVSHVVAISGYNISIIIAALAFLAKYIGRKSSFWVSLGIILAFVVMAGASSSVIRAAVMGGLLLLSFQVHRLYNVTPALCASALAMLVLNPKILYWDAGFQLSFLATVGIVYATPVLEQLTSSWPKLFGLKSIVLVTTSAIVATLPLMLLEFGQISLVALPVNLLILPIVPLTMLFGFLTAIPFLGFGFGFIAQILLTYMLATTHWFARLPFSSLNAQVGPIGFAVSIFLIASLYAYLWLHLQSRDKTKILSLRELTVS